MWKDLEESGVWTTKKTTKCLSSDHGTKKRGFSAILEAKKRGFYAFFTQYCNQKRDRARFLRGFGTKKPACMPVLLQVFTWHHYFDWENGLKKKPVYSGLFRIFRFIPEWNIPVYSGPEYLPLPAMGRAFLIWKFLIRRCFRHLKPSSETPPSKTMISIKYRHYGYFF